MRTFAVRRKIASTLFTNFLISFALTVVVTRMFLWMTGYIKLGGEVLHIAHLNWGGLGLLVAALMMMLFRGKMVLYVGSILTGVGWGFFIDEIGKFITANNDYFFRPAAALIYIIFLLSFVFMLYIRRKQEVSMKSKLYHAMEALEEVVERDLDPYERMEIEDDLEEISINADEKEVRDLAAHLLKFIRKQEVSSPKNDLLYKFRQLRVEWDSAVEQIPDRLILKLFSVVLTVKILGAILWIGAIVSVIIGIEIGVVEQLLTNANIQHNADSALFLMMNLLRLLVSLILLTTLRGVSEGKPESIRIVTIALWVSLGFVDVFDFYFNQFEAVVSSLIDILLLAFIRDYSHKLVKDGSVEEEEQLMV